ncbi:MAG TPA: lamin tail domain-containing protein, partial [Saprospiraceae bacterium]|nr:lamin tail domain-containing protein [Saprospiraceae bacterium]
RLLAAPHARQRYLAHMRTLIADEMDSAKFNALIDQYDALIGAEVLADTKKIYSNAQYNTEKTTLKNFVANHRNTLLAHPEMNIAPPALSDPAMSTQGGSWANPVADEAAHVSVKASATNGIAGVNVYYCPSLYGRFQKTPMYDDGQHNDGNSGDGVYGASLPGYATGTWMRFYFEAKANNTPGTLAFLPTGAEHDVYYYQVSAALADDRPVVINEVMAVNQNAVTDEAGEHEDWIELYNLTNSPVDLGGWALTDDPSKPQKWVFEAGTTIGPKDYLIVWADEDGSQGSLHANFKLSASGESIALLNTELRIVDSVSFGPQQVDMGYARRPNGTGPFVSQAHTFKANNGNSSATFEPSTAVSLRAYPNPARHTLVVLMEGEAADLPLVVADVSGKIMHTLAAQPAQQLDVSAWAPGMYFLRWGSAVQKVVVQWH